MIRELKTHRNIWGFIARNPIGCGTGPVFFGNCLDFIIRRVSSLADFVFGSFLGAGVCGVVGVICESFVWAGFLE